MEIKEGVSPMKFSELKDKVVEVLSEHIGEENSILSTDFFQEVYDIAPEDYDLYERHYRWEAILRANSALRSENALFVITKYNKSFVLKTNGEKIGYHIVQDARKRAIDGLKRNSSEWVEKKMWKNIKKKKKKKLAMFQ